MINSSKVSALANWLAAGAPPKRSFPDFVAELGKRPTSAGLRVDQFGIYLTMIHPEIPGRLTYWTKAGSTRMSTLTPEQLREGDVWIGTPAHHCQQTGRMVVHTLGSSPEFDSRKDSQRLAERGYRQFVFTPLHSNYYVISAASYGTKSEHGFSEDEVHALRMLQSNLARVVESFVLYESTVQILSTYVGRDAGSRVLEGNILRGDTEAIPSIVLFTDLRDFTALSNARPASEVIELLNDFYDIAEAAIGNNGGEILKFMGDGLLAIFPTPDDLAAQMAASVAAIAALEETRTALGNASLPEIRFRASLHLGDIHYGNIGSKSRMDFTAIGPTVNLAARLLSAADDFGAEIVCSKAFHSLVPERTSMLGEQEFKGFDTPQPVYSVAL
jgi:adenylate cyclase